MGERTIAEIIGCDACRGTGHLGEPDENCVNCQGRGCMDCVFRVYDHDCFNDCPSCCACLTCDGFAQSTAVDDLLAWLVDHDWFPYELYPDPGYALEAFDVYLRHINVPYADEATCDAWSKQFIHVGGRTLLAALEAAVRAVDQSSLAAAGKPAGEAPTLAPPTPATSQSRQP